MKRLSLQIREEIEETQLWLDKLRVVEEVMQVIETRRTLPAKDHHESTKERKKRSTRNLGALHRMRAAVIAFLEKQHEPVHSRAMLDAIVPGSGSGNSTFWKATKELRDEGRVTWDTEMRTYEIVRTSQKEVA